MRISSIFPAYNEAKNIEESVRSIIAFFKNNSINDWEVIVVNDGSIDNTESIVKKIIINENRVKLINHRLNKGYGETIQSGLSKAKFDWIFITDSDLQFFVDDLKKLIPYSDKFDFIQGIRVMRKDSRWRVVLGKIYKIIVIFFFKIPVSDPECSFRLFKKDLIKNFKFYSRGPMVPVELILISKKNNASFKEVSVRHRLRRHGQTNALSIHSLKMVFIDFFNLFFHKIKGYNKTFLL